MEVGADDLYQVLYNPRWRCFSPPPLSLFSAFLWHLIVRKCAWWMGIVVKAPQKGNKYSTGRMGISFFTVAGTSGVALPHQL